MVDEKNNVTFNISGKFKIFQSMQEKISSNEMEHFVKLWIRDSRPIVLQNQSEKETQWRKKSDITNWSMHAYIVIKSSSHVEKK